jgi:hypothetical protein
MDDRNQMGSAVTNPDRFFVIGAPGDSLNMPSTGQLWLGFNDDRQSDNTYDNSGFVSVSVQENGAGPGVPENDRTLLLLVAGVTFVGALGCSKHRLRPAGVPSAVRILNAPQS